MMRTRAITIGLIASLASACAATETRADYSRICLDEDGARVEDNLCPENDQRGGDAMVGYFYPVWLYGRYPAPAIGAKPSADSYTTTKPAAGSIARPPARGGFGTFKSGSGGG